MSDLRTRHREAWPTEPLGNLCDIIIGRTPSRDQPTFWDGEHPWLSIADMNQGPLIRKTKERITTLGVIESGSRLIPQGTVLLSFKLSIGKVAVSDIDLYTNEAIAALPILAPQRLFRDFLFWVLSTIQLDKEVDVAAKGKTLNKSKLERLEIPLPALDDQKRIAAVLRKADELRHQRHESLGLSENLMRSVFIDMFGDPETNPKGWDQCSLEDLCERIVDCPHSTPIYSDTPTAFYCVRSSDIQNGKLDLASARYVSEYVFAERIARHEPKTGEVIYTREGGRLGHAGQVPKGRRICLGQRMMLFCGKAKVTSNAFLNGLLNAASFRSRVLKLVGGGAAPRVNIKDLRTITVYRPPFANQDRYEQFATALAEEEETLVNSQMEVSRLFASIQQRAFQGELDLSRLILDPPSDLSAAPEPGRPVTKVESAAPFLRSPQAIEASLIRLDNAVNKGEQIAWSADYFKYRIVGVQPTPFSFGDVVQKAQSIFEESLPYEEIKAMFLELLGQGGGQPVLSQRFDLHIDKETKDGSGRREIVFEPTA
jgi:type I restriction enzyme S subunit